VSEHVLLTHEEDARREREAAKMWSALRLDLD
jgi:hypothetical protein